MYSVSGVELDQGESTYAGSASGLKALLYAISDYRWVGGVWDPEGLMG